jgi:hypothetical protein
MSIPQFFLSITMFVQSPMLLAATEQDGRWHVGIGDPTIWGWLTVGMYLLVIARCYVKAKHHMQLAEPYRFWLLLGLFLLLLAINKQLDLQTLFTQLMRDAAVEHGWYEHRRQLQILFICCVGLAMLIALITLRIALIDHWRRYQFIWLGLLFLSAFVLIRAASFHHIDIMIHESVMGLELNVVLENTALMLILLGTYRHGQLVHSSAGVQLPAPKAYQASSEGEDVYCPRCETKAMSKAAHGRLFKCKSCAHKYQVYVVG